MSSLDNIIQKIEEEAKAQEARILKDAEHKKDVFQNQRVGQANQYAKELKDKTNREVNPIKENVVSSAELKARDRKLSAKQFVVEKIIAEVKERLVNLDDNTYISYLKNTLDAMDLPAGSELIVPKDKRAAVENANIGYKLSDESIPSGFAINDGNIRLNNDFESLIEFQKEELQAEIIEKLY